MDRFGNYAFPISPKKYPHKYFKKYETLDGINSIRIYYQDFNPSGPMSFDRYVEIRTDYVRGMKKGFYILGFDYALVVGEKILCLEHVYRDKNGREFGCFAQGYATKSLSEIDEKEVIWRL